MKNIHTRTHAHTQTQTCANPHAHRQLIYEALKPFNYAAEEKHPLEDLIPPPLNWVGTNRELKNVWKTTTA